MRKSPIKVKIKRSNSALSSSGDYIVTQITGAVTIWGKNSKILRAGDLVDEDQAEELTKSYQVTVTA